MTHDDPPAGDLPLAFPVHVAEIVRTVARHTGYQVETILGRSRTPSVVRVRQVAMLLVRRRLRCSYPEIGRAFGRDHATVIYAIGRVETALAEMPRLRALVAEIEAELDRNEARRCA